MSRRAGVRAAARRRSSGQSGSHIYYGSWDASRGQAGIETALANSIGWVRPPPLNTFARGYSGDSHPATFAASSVSNAVASWNGRAMLNTKLSNWPALANGTYDSLIRGFYQSWPIGVRGWVTCNHEPENDGKNTQAAAWCAGMARYISVAAEVIRDRGLDVSVGGNLMGFSFSAGGNNRWVNWNWWDLVADIDLPQTCFFIDQYAACLTNPVRGENIVDDLNRIFDIVRPTGISRFAIFETALDRRQRGTLDEEVDVVIGTDQTLADWIPGYRDGLEDINGLEAACWFHSPVGPASEHGQLNGPALGEWANVIATGKRI